MSSAVLISMLDVSGSIDEEQKRWVDREQTKLEAALRARHGSVIERCVVFHAVASEVERKDFTTTAESGGTMISTGVGLASRIAASYPRGPEPAIVAVLFTDGDNWSFEDTVECMRILSDEMLPRVAAFGLAQLEGPYGSGQFIVDLEENVGSDARVVARKIGSTTDAFAEALLERIPAKRPKPKRKPAQKRPRARSKAKPKRSR